MEEDQVGLTTYSCQLVDTTLEILVEEGIGTSEVELVAITLVLLEDERVCFGQFLAQGIVFGKDTHTYLVKLGLGQRPYGLILQILGHVHPGISRGADRIIGCAILIDEGPARRLDHAMACLGIGAADRTPDMAELSYITVCLVMPFTGSEWHKTDLIPAIAIVEATNLQRVSAILPEGGRERDILKGIACRRATETDLITLIATHRRLVMLAANGKGNCRITDS